MSTLFHPDYCEGEPCEAPDSEETYTWEQGQDIHGGTALWSGHRRCYEAALRDDTAVPGVPLTNDDMRKVEAEYGGPPVQMVDPVAEDDADDEYEPVHYPGGLMPETLAELRADPVAHAEQMLRDEADESVVAAIEQMKHDGTGEWMPDDYVPNVVGFVLTGTRRALVVVYLEDSDFEVSEELEELAHPPEVCGRTITLGARNDAYGSSCYREPGHDGPHKGLNPFGDADNDMDDIEWTGGGSAAGDPLPFRIVSGFGKVV